MRITGTNSYVKFDLENGHVLKAEGEMLTNGRFVAFKDTMNRWEPPFEKETLSNDDINEIIKQVNSNMNESTIQITFE